ncbi:polysaccharide deacetylase family protein [Heliobacterium mobile]|nr:polysaccharide deacetylase family protein [Heliobacterium mobile]
MKRLWWRPLLLVTAVVMIIGIGLVITRQTAQPPDGRDPSKEESLKEWNEEANREQPPEHHNQVQSLAQQYKGVLFYKGNETKKQTALTFDDGPDNVYTPRILDILRAKGIKATFFIVGVQARAHPNVLKRIVDEGHAIGNHSWDHPRLPSLSSAQVIEEVQSTEAEIERITGKRSDLFRPPYGLMTARELDELKSLGYRVIDWSVDTTDWKGESDKKILALVNKEISPGGIILQHCMAGRPGELEGTVKALPQIIDRLRAKGYQFVTVSALLE